MLNAKNASYRFLVCFAGSSGSPCVVKASEHEKAMWEGTTKC